MAGGVGSRFWPASTEETPKQFLDILGVGKSLIQMTVERFLPIVPYDRILIVTNKKYKALVQKHLPEIPESNILCEPSRNNTGPCVAYTALRLFAQNKDAVFVTAPSDHVILKEAEFLSKIEKGIEFVTHNQGIVTLGLEPNRPDTGYGYIEIDREIKEKDGVSSVKQFREKPDLATAESYLQSGNYLWNAGIFIWKASYLLDSFQQFAPDIIEVLTEDQSQYNTQNEQAYIDRVYPQTPSISVDYAILEKSDNVFTIPAEIGWSDLGTWNSLHAYLDKDENDTVTLGKNTYLEGTKNCIVRTDSNKIVVIKNLENYIVVDEQDALLIYPKSEEQEIKKIVKAISN